MNTAIFAFVPASAKSNLDAAMSAVLAGQRAFVIPLGATIAGPATHFGMYDETTRAPANAVLFSACKAGDVPDEDVNGDPIAWGEDGILSLVDAQAAFATLQYWLNDSDVPPHVFAMTNAGAAGLVEVEPEI